MLWISCLVLQHKTDLSLFVYYYFNVVLDVFMELDILSYSV